MLRGFGLLLLLLLLCAVCFFCVCGLWSVVCGLWSVDMQCAVWCVVDVDEGVGVYVVCGGGGGAERKSEKEEGSGRFAN